MTRPTKTQLCPLPNAMRIYLSDSDIVDYYKVDDSGYIRPNKRAWAGLDVTVILGRYQVEDQSIFVPANTSKWLCQIGSNTWLSGIGKEHADKEVTIIVHK
jgi:hypothetical protein